MNMKKISLLIMLSLAMSVSFAQVKSVRSINNLPSRANSVEKTTNLKRLSTEHAMLTVSPDNCVPTSLGKLSPALKTIKANTDALEVEYDRPKGTFFEGFTRDYRSYSNVVYLHSPAITPVDYSPWVSDNTATFSWVYNNGNNSPIADPVDANGTLHFSADITPSGYISYLPKVTAATATETASFVIGQNVANQYLLAASVERTTTEDGTIFDGVDEFATLTMANNQLNRPAGPNLYGGFQNGDAFSPSYSNDDGPCVGIMQYIPQLKSPLYVESVSILAYETGGTAVPAGGEIQLEFYYVNPDGTFGQKIAESTTNEFVTTYATQGVFIFKFIEEVDGFITDVPVTLGTDADIALIIKGFDSSWHFNFLFGSADGFGGSAYTLHGQDLAISTFGYSNLPDLPSTDLYILFNGIFNCLTPAVEYGTINFPTEGGWGITLSDVDGDYNDYNLYTAYNIDESQTDVWVEVPDWISDFESVDDAFEGNNIISLFFQADPLPVGTQGRSGNIVVASYGVSVTIPVIQGSATAIDNVNIQLSKVINTLSEIQLIYPSDFKSVNLYSASGQMVGKYALPTNGRFNIPAQSLVKGVYMLRFTGNKTETVKIVR
jgi:hypothetical protein